MNKWCKIFEVDDKQVLFWWELKDKLEGKYDYMLHQMLQFAGGICCDIVMTGFDSEKHVKEVFDAINVDAARALVNEMMNFIKASKGEHDLPLPADTYDDV